MGFESRIYVVEKSRLSPDEDGKRLANVVAMFNACNFPGLSKDHQNLTWRVGFKQINCLYEISSDDFYNSKTYVNGTMTDDIEAIRKYIITKPHTRPLTWTNREKPDWWEV